MRICQRGPRIQPRSRLGRHALSRVPALSPGQCPWKEAPSTEFNSGRQRTREKGAPYPSIKNLSVTVRLAYAPMPSSNEPVAVGKQRLSRTYWMPLALVASTSR